ncbi:hypothetical protein CHUAL_001847 [Chamberlinius hualienensis]
MPGEQYSNASSGKEEDSDQDTFILVSSSDFDTPSSLESMSFGMSSAMATKLTDGSPEKAGPSHVAEVPGDGHNTAGEPQPLATGHQPGMAGGPSAGGGSGAGGGGNGGGNDPNQPPDQILEDDSHEPVPSGSSTSSASIQGLAPVDPALDINTADLWPNLSLSDRNGHSDESGLSHATTAIVSDGEGIEVGMSSSQVVNPLIGATSSSSSSTSGSKAQKATSVSLDSTTSTISSTVSSRSSLYDEKRLGDHSLSRMDASTVDLSGDQSVEGLLSSDGKLDEYFNTSSERFTNTPADDIIMDFNHSHEILETSDDNEMVIPSTQEEEVEKMSFVVPDAPLPSTSGALKRRADGTAEENVSASKVARPLLLKLQCVNTTKIEPVAKKKLSERAIAMDKFGQFIERGLKTSETDETVAVAAVELLHNDENLSNDNVQCKSDSTKELSSIAINRRLLFDSSQSSSSGGESSFRPVVAASAGNNINNPVMSTAVPETDGKWLVDMAPLEGVTKKSDIAEDEAKSEVKSSGNEVESQVVDSQSIIESSQPSTSKTLLNKPVEKDNFILRYSSSEDVNSQYFPFEKDDKLSGTDSEVEQNTSIKPKDSVSSCEVPARNVTLSVETVEKTLKPNKPEESDETKKLVPVSLDESVVPATDESQLAESADISNSVTDLPSSSTEENVESNVLSTSNEGKRRLGDSDCEDDVKGRHKRKKISTDESLSSRESAIIESSTNPSLSSSAEIIISHTSNNALSSKTAPKLTTRDQEVQTVENRDNTCRTPSDSKAVVRRTTVLIKRIVIEEFLRHGRVYKKTTEETNEDPVITEYYEGNENPETFVSPLPVERDNPLDSSSKLTETSISSAERSGTSSGWLADFSSSASKSSGTPARSKKSSKGVTPKLPVGGSDEATSSGSFLGMKTLRSDKSVPETADDVAFSTPKNTAESSFKRESKGHKSSESTPLSAEKGSEKKKKIKTKLKTVYSSSKRKRTSEEKLNSPKKSSISAEINKICPPREQLILKLNLKSSSSSIVSPKQDDSRILKPGARVMAKYRDGFYYPGRAVDQERHDRWKILYDDGDTRSIRVENILVVDLLPVGQSIYVLSHDGFYDSAIIIGYIEVSGDIQYAIEMDDGAKRQVKQNEVILTTDQAACMEKLPLGTMHGYTSICLDNIIEGKRRSRDLASESSSKSSRRERHLVIGSPSTYSANDESDHSSTHFRSSK